MSIVESYSPLALAAASEPSVRPMDAYRSKAGDVTVKVVARTLGADHGFVANCEGGHQAHLYPRVGRRGEGLFAALGVQARLYSSGS